MLIVTEEMCRQAIGRGEAFAAVESVFAAMARGDAYNFPVIREAIGYEDALYGFKSGFDKAGKSLGVKSGGYWPNNAAKGLTNHQSTIFLFDPDTGMLNALVGGNYLTAVRTAAASSVSIAHLARKDAEVIGMVGAGHQSTFQLRAALEQRIFKKVVGWNLDPADLTRLADVAKEFGLKFEAVEREELARQAENEQRTFCLMLYYTGARISEVLNMTYGDIDNVGLYITIESLKKRRKGIFRRIPLPDNFLDELQMVHNIKKHQKNPKAKRDRLWTWTRNTGYRKIMEIMKLANIEGVHACPKGLRHSFAIHCLEKNIPLNMVSKWMGHSSLEVRTIYANVLGKEVRRKG